MGKNLILIPSTYTVIGWIILLSFIIISPSEVDQLSKFSLTLATFVIVTNAIATLLFWKSFYSARHFAKFAPDRFDRAVLFFSGSMGIYGLASYTNDLIGHFGGLTNAAYALTFNTLDIRASANDLSSFAFQMSTLSWIAIFIGFFIIKDHRKKSTSRY